MQRQLEGNIPDDQLWDSSSYLVESVFQTLRKMFTNAREIQVMITYITSLASSTLSCYSRLLLMQSNSSQV